MTIQKNFHVIYYVAFVPNKRPAISCRPFTQQQTLSFRRISGVAPPNLNYNPVDLVFSQSSVRLSTFG